ncbi:hypothetical protein BZA05DRAFT_476137 [Tricharina praecox]|uniref:uncharacterized protein n=1 Tax=Tricharina praecox TaxID=43433 RepID=UPI0022204630|nr:uncharacterized protein BZA05DRAFT_476137 [Tricharina praecox]KAI5846807.1 hypothetical protein BZA05DRAFT_476137 [Tricharina praecox]
MYFTDSESALPRRLRDAPKSYDYRYTTAVQVALLKDLFNSLGCHRRDYMNYFFPNGLPTENTPEAWSLSAAQGATEGAEYSAGARGKPCGHIFKSGEATYRCKTCSLDDACVLCSKCFESSDHDGHTVFVSVSPGNSGCCDCGDAEAWRIPVKCAIHTPTGDTTSPMETDDTSQRLPPELVASIRNTIARALDYLCDVISCSPEQLRLAKSEAAIRKDEAHSRLTSRYQVPETDDDDMEYALVLWNDEKHTIADVQKQVSRACRETSEFGKLRAHEVNNTGRSVLRYSTNIAQLLDISRIIEHIKVTVTIRSARDTFREQMCGTIIEWLDDIAGCSVGGDHNIIRTTICEELLSLWRVGSKASNTEIGQQGIDDHSYTEERINVDVQMQYLVPMELTGVAEVEDEDMEVEVVGGAVFGDDDELDEDDVDMVGSGGGNSEDGNSLGDGAFTIQRLLRADEFDTPRPVDLDGTNERHAADDPESGAPRIPHTPHIPPLHGSRMKGPAPPYWTEKPTGYARSNVPAHEDLRQRVRLDWLIMFDLRLWKKARIGLRDLYISTVVAIPQFKRILGLRFAGLYPALAELYLIADREPDHSIINLSLQMLTTPTITAEVVKRANFLTTLTAIIYSFLTTRQVGLPSEINPAATLAFEGGPLTNPLTNRRMYHFFQDMRYLLGSKYVQEQIRSHPRYTLQFLDLVRLHQGICPNVRAVTEHVEYEAEAWISASLVTKEINKMSRQFSEAFRTEGPKIEDYLRRAIATAAKYAIESSLGFEKHRYRQTEMKSEPEFKQVGGFAFDTDRWGKPYTYKIVRFSVDKQPISFHHALHYSLSWLIEAGKSMTNDELRPILLLKWEMFKSRFTKSDTDLEPEDLAVAMFDYPLRVCVWLAQMKTNMWVRNGYSLKHQMQTYRSVTQRDLTHHRDIFLLQTSLVTVNPSRMLVSMIDRFNLNHWMEGNYSTPTGYDDAQVLDLAEDFLHLLIVILSDRLPLIPQEEEPGLQALRIRRELVHTLCFKPMQYSDLSRQIPERLLDSETFQEVLTEVANYRPPDGLADYGTFELKEAHLDEVDPYISHFTKNQREDIEVKYRARMAKKLGKPETEIVFEPRLLPIRSGVFKDLAAFTRTPVFAQIIYYFLAYSLHFKTFTPAIQETRVEIFLQLVLHLCQLATLEDTAEEGAADSFILHALEKQAPAFPSEVEGGDNGQRTIATALYRLADTEDFKGCRAKINHILRSFKQKQPTAFATVAAWATAMGEKLEVDEQDLQEAEMQRKKQMAMERNARILAQMKEQQQSFLANTTFNFGDSGDDLSDTESDASPTEEKRLWKYPTGTCILCQEEMNDSKLYGTQAFVTETNILRQTDPTDADYVYEVAKTPESLDRDASAIRPFGVAGMNRKVHTRLAKDGSEVFAERQGLGRGFPQDKATQGPIVTSCNHLMHFSCFEHYCESTRRRHPFQIARNHPERLEKKEFVCPLCKALGNAFLPIVWKSQEETLTGGVLQPSQAFSEWLKGLGPAISRLEKAGEDTGVGRIQDLFREYSGSRIVPRISNMLQLHPSASRQETMVELRTRPSNASDSPLIAPHPTAPRTPLAPLDELQKTYLRLRDTFLDNKIQSSYQNSHIQASWASELTQSDSLVRTLGFSISAIEIAQRGLASESGFTLLDRIPPQTITHLRILSETISSYFAVGTLQSCEVVGTRKLHQFEDMVRDQLQRLFIGHPQLFEDHAKVQMAIRVGPLLSSDAFLFLAECSVCSVPGFSWDILHIMRLCYTVEIVKAVIVFGRDCELPDILREWERSERLADIEGEIGYTEAQLDSLQQFVKFVEKSLGKTVGGLSSHSSFSLAVFRHLVGAYATPFLRKCIILLHTRFGVVFPPSGFAEMTESEQVRLCRVLRLPSVDEILETALSKNSEGEYLQGVIAGWCRHLTIRKTSVTMPHPGILELVGLPKNYDVLVEEAMKRRCPSTGNELTEPSVCLFCGEIFCSQARCCLERIGNEEEGFREIGGCNIHVRKCGKTVGLFINIRKCALLHLHDYHGSWNEAPYLDAHGETDVGLRHHRQLFLNQRRYDALLRNVWLQHGIPSVISRKMESELNTGGWDSL